MAENTLQFEWIVLIKHGLEACFIDRKDIFIAGDLFWYPVENHPEIRLAPDVLVVLGRPKGHRGSYLQFLEENIAPQVVFEILSPGNRPAEMVRKFGFYQKYGVQEYYLYDPDKNILEGHHRVDDKLVEIPEIKEFTSPLLGITFKWNPQGLQLFQPDGKPFLSYLELVRANHVARAAAQSAKNKAQAAEKRAESAEIRAQKLEEKLRKLGIDPDA